MMKLIGLCYAGWEYAEIAANRWGEEMQVVHHISDSGNSVYALNDGNRNLILRLTDPNYRSASENEAELEYLRHLDRVGVRVSTPLKSVSGKYVEVVNEKEGEMFASVFTYAPGGKVTKDSKHWGEGFLRFWGKMLATIHAGSITFTPSLASRRWHWRNEVFFAYAYDYIPSDDKASRQELEKVLAWIDRLQETPREFGMIHGDFAPQNFFYDPEVGITAFDFGNCCYHWYISDIAISLSVLHHSEKQERDKYRSWLLEGYREVLPINEYLLENVEWFIRLRLVYVYLSRLMKFGPQPTAKEEKILSTMRQRVVETFQW